MHTSFPIWNAAAWLSMRLKLAWRLKRSSRGHPLMGGTPGVRDSFEV